ncbi:type II secretion system protein [bacterium]|nr:type II secretion system protein [bacterium]
MLLIVAVLAAIALPNYVKLKDKAKEAESKSALHAIQIAIERSAVDNQGSYPQYLIGGDNEYMNYSIGGSGKLNAEVFEIAPDQCSDPLLRGGYVDSYPRNPFVREGRAVHTMQRAIGDPLRSSLSDGQQMGTRFGAYGSTMGQVLCDSRWLTWTRVDPQTREVKVWPTWANVQFNFFDVWPGNRARPYLAGSFMYKSMGDVLPSSRAEKSKGQYTINRREETEDGTVSVHESDAAVYPVAITDYMLSAWGGSRTKGMDILGEEPLVMFKMRAYKRPRINPGVFRPSNGGLGPYIPPPPPASDPGEAAAYELRGLPAWTRGVNRSHIGPLWGSPYGPATDDGEQLSYGNPNGIRDGLIILLTPGRE